MSQTSGIHAQIGGDCADSLPQVEYTLCGSEPARDGAI